MATSWSLVSRKRNQRIMATGVTTTLLPLLQPAQHSHAVKSAPLSDTIVADYANGDHAVELARDRQVGQRTVCDQSQALAPKVNDGQDAEAAIVGHGVRQEVWAPALVGPSWQSRQRPCLEPPLSAAPGGAAASR